MNQTKAALTIFIFLILLTLFQAAYYYPQMPERSPPVSMHRVKRMADGQGGHDFSNRFDVFHVPLFLGVFR